MAFAKKVAEGSVAVDIPAWKEDGQNYLDGTFDIILEKLAEKKEQEQRLNRLERQAIVGEIASYLAHEIRNPLNLIMLTAHHLGNKFAPADETLRKKHEELIASLKSEVEHLSNVISGFLSVGKPSELMKSAFRMDGLIDQILLLVKPQLTTKKVVLEISGNTAMEIVADPEQMRLVLLNLILNAIKAVSLNGRIWLSIGRVDGIPPLSQITITDDGPGIEPESMGKLFEPYFTQQSSGIGLGLSLVKRIVEEHGGTITAENCNGKGAQFTILLPLEG
jgi:two-component system sensor histidine kinase HydH